MGTKAMDTRRVRAWLEEKGIKSCGTCGSEDLQVSKDLYALVCINAVTGVPDMQRGSRVARLRCGNCGTLVLLHARQIGLE